MRASSSMPSPSRPRSLRRLPRRSRPRPPSRSRAASPRRSARLPKFGLRSRSRVVALRCVPKPGPVARALSLRQWLLRGSNERHSLEILAARPRPSTCQVPGRTLPIPAFSPSFRRLADRCSPCSCSSVGLERLTVDQEVGGSNPPSCTNEINKLASKMLVPGWCRVTVRVTTAENRKRWWPARASPQRDSLPPCVQSPSLPAPKRLRGPRLLSLDLYLATALLLPFTSRDPD